MKSNKLSFEKFLEYIITKCDKIRNDNYNSDIKESDIIEILMDTYLDKLKLKSPEEFYGQLITETEIDNVIDNYDFNHCPNEITIDFELPNEYKGLERKVRIKNNGKILVIHKNDLDPFPSNPHAHYIDRNLKIDLSNGNCYQIRKYVFSIQKKELLEIRNKASKIGVKLPDIE